MCDRAGGQVGEGPDNKRERGERPRRDREAGPFQKLAEVVRAGDHFEEPAAGHLVAGLARLSQVGERPVSTVVDDEARNEQGGSDQESGIPQPRVGVTRRQCVEPTCVQVRVPRVEHHTHQNDDRSGARLARPHPSGEDEGPVDVVGEPHRPEERRCSGAEVTEIPTQ